MNKLVQCGYQVIVTAFYQNIGIAIRNWSSLKHKEFSRVCLRACQIANGSCTVTSRAAIRNDIVQHNHRSLAHTLTAAGDNVLCYCRSLQGGLGTTKRL